MAVTNDGGPSFTQVLSHSIACAWYWVGEMGASCREVLTTLAIGG
jgi:hypothetical protein